MHGVHDAATDEAAVREMWRRWPRANLGIATGQVSGFDVLDVDPRHDGDETLAELVREWGPLPDTVEQITGGGGRHILFAYSGRNLGSAIGPGLDIRSDGDLIVAPPSLHASGRHYEWEAASLPDEVQIASWPTWLLNLAAPKATMHASPRLRVGTSQGRPIPEGRWERVLAGCKRLRELADIQKRQGVTYAEWLAVIALARLGGTDGRLWALDFTSDYAKGSTVDDLTKAYAWLSGNLTGVSTCATLGCHPGKCGFRRHEDEAGQPIEPSPLRHAWGRTLTVEVA